MSKRLQVVFDDEEYEVVRQTAARHGMTLSDWVRRTLRRAQRDEASDGVADRLAAIRDASRHRFPAPDIDTMLDEIEQGYMQG